MTKREDANTVAGGSPVERGVRPVAELRELAQEGVAIHGENAPERIVCDWLLWALDEIERLRAALTLAAPALEIGCDALRAEAERYHAEMRGYRPHKHQALDDDYKRADLAWQAAVAALGPNA